MAVSSIGATSAAIVSKDEFLKLFVAQLKNQSPLDPLKGHEFIAQLAQFSTVEQLTSLNTSFANEFKFQQLLGGGDLIGRSATYVDTAFGGAGQGVIQGSKISNGITTVTINNQDIPISDLTGIF
ncbi:MAG: flagellar hook assembly protein FlgD [Candidatus Scalindua sp.]